MLLGAGCMDTATTATAERLPGYISYYRMYTLHCGTRRILRLAGRDSDMDTGCVFVIHVGEDIRVDGQCCVGTCEH